MRRIRYQVACSLDGYIADVNGGFDWIIADPEIDFGAMFNQYDTLLMGRTTFAELPKDNAHFKGMHIVVFSTTLRQEDYPGVTIVCDEMQKTLEELRSRPGKDIWLFGGGKLFRSIWNLGLVDSVEPAVIPVLLGGGLPFLPPPATKGRLTLTGHHVYGSGIVLLQYDVERNTA